MILKTEKYVVHGKLLAGTCALIFVIMFDTNYLQLDNGLFKSTESEATSQ